MMSYSAQLDKFSELTARTQLAKERGASVLGSVGRDGDYTAQRERMF